METLAMPILGEGAHYAIGQVLARYCHAVDRCDLELLKTVFWEDGLVDYGPGEIPPTIFCEGLIPSLQGMALTQHRVSNILVDQSDASAKVESYCVAFHLIQAEDSQHEMEVGGRYLDLFELRENDWRIKHRTYVMDWNRNTPSTIQWDGDLYGQLKHRGGRFPDDPYYKFARS